MKYNGVIDHYDDEGLLLKKAFAEKGVPAVIKTAVDMSEARDTYSEDYALVIKGDRGNEYKYPVVDAGNTLASALYFSEKGSSLPQDLQKTAAANIKKALESFGFSAPEELSKTASMELGYSEAADNNSLEALFGLSGDSSVEIIEDAFSAQTPRGKRRLMFQVKEAGADLFKHLSEDLKDYASDSLGSDFPVSIDLRKTLVTDREGIRQLNDIVELSKTAAVEDLADALEKFDVEHKITHHYNSVIPDAYASVFGDSVEKTANVSQTLEVSGKDYTPESINDWFSGGGQQKISDSFGESFADEFKSDPSGVLASLPVTHKEAIARMIDEGY